MIPSVTRFLFYTHEGPKHVYFSWFKHVRFIFGNPNTIQLTDKQWLMSLCFGLNFQHFTRSQARSDVSLYTVVSTVHVQNRADAKNRPLIRYLYNETNSRMRHH